MFVLFCLYLISLRSDRSDDSYWMCLGEQPSKLTFLSLLSSQFLSEVFTLAKGLVFLEKPIDVMIRLSITSRNYSSSLFSLILSMLKTLTLGLLQYLREI